MDSERFRQLLSRMKLSLPRADWFKESIPYPAYKPFAAPVRDAHGNSFPVSWLVVLEWERSGMSHRRVRSLDVTH
jgi:hypothetical protein